MTTRHQVSLVTGVLILAIILPVALSIWLAMQQAKAQFYTGLGQLFRSGTGSRSAGSRSGKRGAERSGCRYRRDLQSAASA